jgi:hypothetical protein
MPSRASHRPLEVVFRRRETIRALADAAHVTSFEFTFEWDKPLATLHFLWPARFWRRNDSLETAHRLITAVRALCPGFVPVNGGIRVPFPDGFRGDGIPELARRLVNTFKRFVVSVSSSLEGRRVSRKDAPRVVAALPYRSVRVHPVFGLVVDGYIVTSDTELVLAALADLFREGSDRDIDRLVKMLRSPPRRSGRSRAVV